MSRLIVFVGNNFSRCASCTSLLPLLEECIHCCNSVVWQFIMNQPKHTEFVRKWHALFDRHLSRSWRSASPTLTLYRKQQRTWCHVLTKTHHCCSRSWLIWQPSGTNCHCWALTNDSDFWMLMPRSVSLHVRSLCMAYCLCPVTAKFDLCLENVYDELRLNG